MPEPRGPSRQGAVGCLLILVSLIPAGVLGFYALCRLDPKPENWPRPEICWAIAAVGWAVSGLGALVSLAAVPRPRKALLISAVAVLVIMLVPVALFFGYFATG
jgi:hypothetical protein